MRPKHAPWSHLSHSNVQSPPQASGGNHLDDRIYLHRQREGFLAECFLLTDSEKFLPSLATLFLVLLGMEEGLAGGTGSSSRSRRDLFLSTRARCRPEESHEVPSTAQRSKKQAAAARISNGTSTGSR